jgi:hypothetical protein
MTDSDPTLKVLVEMRDEMRGFRTDFNQRVERLEHHTLQTNERLERLDQNTVMTNHRLEVIEHTLVDFGTQVVMLGRYMKSSVSRHDGNVERHEHELTDLRTRVEKLETKS